jgi:steroid 5-alpha reductase family enzyme
MNPLPLLDVALVSATAMLIGWLIQLRTRNMGISDVLWAVCLGGSALYYGMVSNGSLISQLLVTITGGIWSFRLVMHLLRRMLTEHEDARYRHLRRRWNGNQGLIALLFARRAASATLFSVPLYVAADNPVAEAGVWTMVAAVVFLIGFSGEAYADLQLATFRAKPKHLGHSCRRGLWRYTRHPNYFFGCIRWTSYVFLAIGTPWPLWSLSLIGPLLTMLGWLHAIPLAEEQAIRTRGDDYRAYQAATNRLLPWFPRGWPNDAPDTSKWHTPLMSPRATPRNATPMTASRTPGAYLTEVPAVRLANAQGALKQP